MDTSRTPVFVVLLGCGAFAVAACGDSGGGRAIGASCVSDGSCASGICAESTCIEPQACVTAFEAGEDPLKAPCVAGLKGLALTADPGVAEAGDAVTLTVTAVFIGVDGTTQAADVTSKVVFDATPEGALTFDGRRAEIAPTFSDGDITVTGTLALNDSGTESRQAIGVISVRAPAEWRSVERFALLETSGGPPNLRALGVGLDALGEGLVLWGEGEANGNIDPALGDFDASRLLATGRRARTGGAWGDDAVLATPPADARVGGAVLRVAAGGAAIAAWIVHDPAGVDRTRTLHASLYDPETGWAPSEVLAEATGDVTLSAWDASIAGPGQVLVAWQVVGSDASPVQARRWDGASWGEAEAIDDGAGVTEGASALRVALPDSGPAHVVWWAGASVVDSRSGADGWSPGAAILSAASSDDRVTPGDLAYTSDGRVVVVADGPFDPNDTVGTRYLYASRFTPTTDAWTAPERVSDEAPLLPPSVTWTGSGGAQVAFLSPGVDDDPDISVARFTPSTGWTPPTVLTPARTVGSYRAPIVATSGAATWAVYGALDGDFRSLFAVRADVTPTEAAGTPIEVLDTAMIQYVFATGPGGEGLAVFDTVDDPGRALFAAPLERREDTSELP